MIVGGIMGARLPLLISIICALAACTSTPMPQPSAAPTVMATATAGALTPSASNAPVPALTVDHPTVTVSPAVDLQDGQAVEVRVSGFGVGGKVWLSECATAEEATDLGCGVELAAQPFLVTNDNRAGTGRLIVRARAAGGTFSAGPNSLCLDQCVIVATLGAGYPYVVAPITVAGAWIYVGGIQVNRVSGVSADPILDAETAGKVAMAEIASGRAQMFGTHADAPPMRMIDAAFVPGLVGVVGPAGGTDFEPAEPVAAWVVVSEGHGSDGTYIGVGIVGQNGALLASYIITPGVG
jgi:hypothetical protein